MNGSLAVCAYTFLILLSAFAHPSNAQQAWDLRPMLTNPEQVRKILASRRQKHVENLRSYREGGRFPWNGYQQAITPIFIDANGVHCAVGHLIQQSDQEDLAVKISKENNTVRVSDVKSGPLVDWILSSGLTQEECARIQPSYEFMRQDEEKRKQEAKRIQAHLSKVEQELVDSTATSLATCFERLSPAGPVATVTPEAPARAVRGNPFQDAIDGEAIPPSPGKGSLVSTHDDRP
jgi:hypothetical protein